MLGLGDSQAIARDDDDGTTAFGESRELIDFDRLNLSVDLAAVPLLGAGCRTEATEDDIPDRAIHGFTHDIAQNGPGASDQAPVMMRRSLESMNPAAAAVQPE